MIAHADSGSLCLDIPPPTFAGSSQHTHSLQVPTASQKPGRKRVHSLFQHKSAPNSDL